MYPVWVPEKSWKTPEIVPESPEITFFGISRHPVEENGEEVKRPVQSTERGERRGKLVREEVEKAGR